MGRGKLAMELITKEKKRIATFKKRKEGLVTKIKQLTTLCDVRACMIIYGPDQESRVIEPGTWPENKDEVREMIGIYEARNGGKTFGLSDFFHDRKRKIEGELLTLREKNREAKVSAWRQYSDGLTLEELRKLHENLTLKSEIVKSRIEFLKRNKEGLAMSNMMDPMINYRDWGPMGWFHGPPPMAPSLQEPLLWQEILEGNYGGGNLTEDCVIVPPVALPSNMIPPKAPAVATYEAPFLSLQDQNLDDGSWREIFYGTSDFGNCIEHGVMVAQVAPPLHTIPPQVPAAAPPQWSFLWQENVDDTIFGVMGMTSEGLCYDQ